MNKSFLSLALLIPLCSYAMQIEREYIINDIKDKQLKFDSDGFHIVKRGRKISIPSYNIIPELRNCSAEQLKGYLEQGCLEIKKAANKNYRIAGFQKGLGGGPILGTVAAISVGIIGTVGTLVATVASIPTTGPGCIAVAAAGMAATTKAVTVAAIAGTAAPTP